MIHSKQHIETNTPSLVELKMQAHDLIEEMHSCGISKQDIYTELSNILTEKEVHFADMYTISQVQSGLEALQQIKQRQNYKITSKAKLDEIISKVNSFELTVSKAVEEIQGLIFGARKQRRKLILSKISPLAKSMYESNQEKSRIQSELDRMNNLKSHEDAKTWLEQCEEKHLKEKTKQRAYKLSIVPKEKLVDIFAELKERNSQNEHIYKHDNI